MDITFVLIGYRASASAATKLSPFEVLYARPPVIPPAARETFQGYVDFDDVGFAVAQLVERAELAKRYEIQIGENLAVAQKRDARRFEQRTVMVCK